MANVNKTPLVFKMGSLYDGPYGVNKSISKAKEIVSIGNKNYEMNNQNHTKMEEIILNMGNIKKILTKAGIKKFFPFEPVKGKNEEIIDFTPKGKNEDEIRANIEEYKAKIEEAFRLGKIEEEEYSELNENLEDLVNEKEIKLEDEKDLKLSDEEILDNIKAFIMHNYGEKGDFDKECENYEELSLDDRKFKLQDFNSKINTQLGIVGDLHFLNNHNLKFGDSFFTNENGGYYLTEEEVMKHGLQHALYTMMEKSMFRQLEQQRGEQINSDKKNAMHAKIEQERMKRIREKDAKRKKEQKARADFSKRMRTWNG